MNRLLAFLALITLVSLPLLAQNSLPFPGGARGLALGGTGLTFRDVQAGWTNPAGLAEVAGFSAAVYGEQRFLLSEIRQTGAVAALPVGNSALGLSLGYFGFEAYNEQRVGLAYGRRLADGLHLGGQLLAFRTNIPEYGSAANVSFEIGLQARISPELWVGTRAYNPIRQAVIDGEYLPSVLALGLSYSPNDKLLILAEAEKDIAFPVRVRTGVEYRVVPALHLRVGVATEPVQYSFGLAYQPNDAWRIDLAAANHQYLGITPAVGIVYGGMAQ